MGINDIEWRAREDARTLAGAQEIMEDKDRYEKAISAAKVISAQREAESNAMKKVAGLKVSGKTMAGLNETFRATVASV